MVFRIEELKDVCNNILYAVDNSSTFDNENVELTVRGGSMKFCVSSSEYFVTVERDIPSDDEFNVTVNATLFLKLVSQMSTDTVEMIVEGTHLLIRGNGEYKLPMVFKGQDMFHLSHLWDDSGDEISSGSIGGDILNSVLLFNSKELSKGVVAKPVQRLYYLDNDGAITFTSGACVNEYHVNTPFSMLLSQKVVRLFKLFDAKEEVKFTLFRIPIVDGVDTVGVRFVGSSISVEAILPDFTMMSSVPVKQIRSTATEPRKYSVTLDKKALSDTLNRMLLFAPSGNTAFGTFECSEDGITISLNNSTAEEQIFYETALPECQYKMMLNLKDMKTTVDGLTSMYFTFGFGDNRSVVISCGNVHNVIPECVAV